MITNINFNESLAPAEKTSSSALIIRWGFC